jgi:hypothetical protein
MRWASLGRIICVPELKNWACQQWLKYVMADKFPLKKGGRSFVLVNSFAGDLRFNLMPRVAPVNSSGAFPVVFISA